MHHLRVARRPSCPPASETPAQTDAMPYPKAAVALACMRKALLPLCGVVWCGVVWCGWTPHPSAEKRVSRATERPDRVFTPMGMGDWNWAEP